MKVPKQYKKFIRHTKNGLEVSINTPKEAREFLIGLNSAYRQVYKEDLFTFSKVENGGGKNE